MTYFSRRRCTHAVRALAVTVVGFGASTAVAQGPLTPPAAPAPIYKTLDQVDFDARRGWTPVTAASLPLTISTPGAFYLTENAAVASQTGQLINVTGTGVTFDLNGFRISYAGTTTPVFRVQEANFTLRNGVVDGGQDSVLVQNIATNDARGQLLFEDVTFTAYRSDAIELQSTISAANAMTVIRHCIFVPSAIANDASIRIENVGPGLIEGCQFNHIAQPRLTGRHGIALGGVNAFGWKIIDNHLFDVADVGILIDGAVNPQIIENTIHSCDNDAILIQRRAAAGGIAVTMIGNRIQNCGNGLRHGAGLPVESNYATRNLFIDIPGAVDSSGTVFTSDNIRFFQGGFSNPAVPPEGPRVAAAPIDPIENRPSPNATVDDPVSADYVPKPTE